MKRLNVNWALLAGVASFALFILSFSLCRSRRLPPPLPAAALPGGKIHRCSVVEQWRETRARKRRAGCPRLCSR